MPDVLSGARPHLQAPSKAASLRYRIYILVATLIWGSSFVVTKDAISLLPPSQVLLFRFSVAIPIVATVFRGHLRACLEPGHIRCGLALGLVTFLAFFLQVSGLTYATPGKNAFLTSMYCIIVPFLVWAMSGRRPGAHNFVAAVLCIVGVGFVSLDESLGLQPGDGITLAGAFFYALQFMLLSRFSQGRDVFALTIWYFAGASACAIVVLLGFGHPVLPAEIPARTWACLVYLAVVVTAIALVLQNVSMAHLPPATASVLSSLETVFAVLISLAVGAEMLTPRIVAGFAIMFAGIMCSEAVPLWLERRK